MNALPVIPKDNEVEWYESVLSEGPRQYRQRVPPGYADLKDKEGFNVFGDLVSWKQILEYAQSRSVNLIFLTDDQKEDWWLQVRGNTLGPRPELVEEFK